MDQNYPAENEAPAGAETGPRDEPPRNSFRGSTWAGQPAPSRPKLGQLVLTRKANQPIDLPDLGISVMVTQVHDDGSVSLGIRAPKEIRILRRELLSAEERRRLGLAA